jgi:hypothetical protein
MSLGGRNASVRTKAVAAVPGTCPNAGPGHRYIASLMRSCLEGAAWVRIARPRAALLRFVKAGVSPRIWLTRGGELDRDRQL